MWILRKVSFEGFESAKAPASFVCVDSRFAVLTTSVRAIVCWQGLREDPDKELEARGPNRTTGLGGLFVEFVNSEVRGRESPALKDTQKRNPLSRALSFDRGGTVRGFSGAKKRLANANIQI